MDELLRMEHVSKRFGDFYANRDINLSVRKGEVHTLPGDLQIQAPAILQ